MQFDAKPSAHMKGRVMWAVINDDGSVADNGTLEPAEPSSNLVLNQGLDQVGSNMVCDLFRYVCIGTGTSTPAVTQIELDNEHARTGNTYNPLCGTDTPADGASPFTITYRRGWDFPKGTLDSSIDGAYAELGFSPFSTAGTNLFSRTLIKDGGGNTTTVSVSSDQILRVSYELDVTLGPSTPTAGSTTVTNLGTINYTYQLGVINGVFHSNNGPQGQLSSISYVNGGGGSNIDTENCTIGIFEPSIFPYISGDYAGNSVFGNLTFGTKQSGVFGGPKMDITATEIVGQFNFGEIISEYTNDITVTNPSTGVFRYTGFFSIGQGNDFSVRTIGLGVAGSYDNNADASVHFELDAGSEFTKTDTHELTLEFEVTFTAN